MRGRWTRDLRGCVAPATCVSTPNPSRADARTRRCPSHIDTVTAVSRGVGGGARLATVRPGGGGAERPAAGAPAEAGGVEHRPLARLEPPPLLRDLAARRKRAGRRRARPVE